MYTREEKVEKLKSFLKVLQETDSATEAEKQTGVNRQITSKLLSYGILCRQGSRSKPIWTVLNLDPATLEDIAEAVMPRERRTRRNFSVSLPPPAVDAPPFPAISTTEEMAKHVARLGELLGVQFGTKTPPGLYSLCMEKDRKIRELQGELKDLRKRFNMLRKAIGSRLPEEKEE